MSALPHYHPSDETLIGYAAGTLSHPVSVLIASHLTLCPACRRALSAAEAVGGAMLDSARPASALSCTAADVLALIGTDKGRDTPVAAVADAAPAVNDNRPVVRLPRPVLALAGADPASLKWRWMGTGVRYAYLAGDDREGRVGLMRIAPGTRLPRHGHTGEEFTMVLSGGYCDDSGHFARGDVEWADDDTVHQPRADREGECLCLVVTTGTLKAKGWLAPLLQPLMAI